MTTHNPLLQTILLKYSLYKSLLESKFPVAIFLFLCLLNHCHFVQSNVPTGGASIRTAKQFWATILLYYDGKNFCGKKFSWIKISHESFRFLRNLFSWTWKKLVGNHFQRHCQNPFLERICLHIWSILTKFYVTRI